MNTTSRKYVLAGAALLVLGLGLAVIVRYSPGGIPLTPAAQNVVAPQTGGARTQTSKKPAAGEVQTFPILAAEHIDRGQKGTYNSNPPTSGPHVSATINWGEYDQPVEDEFAVHLLEHGGIWIAYQPGLDAGALDRLRQIAKAYPNAVLLAPRPGLTSKISLMAWGVRQNFSPPNLERIEGFIARYVNNSPEEMASLTEVPKPAAGKPFPDFSLVDVDGNPVTKSAMAGKPSIIWFTAAWCVPCQIGAKVVRVLDRDLGDDAFNVVVVFVDTRETEKDLRDWKEDFANPDWIIAFDSEFSPVAKKVALRFLDSKYLLDREGVLRDADFEIADAAYLSMVRDLVKEN